MSTHTAPLPQQYAASHAFQQFLDAHLGQEMLRFTTAGSVDDGKSTLIGRLLHDTKSIYEDQLAAVKQSRVNRAANGHVDFSLLTDGLRAEREQGITIDVAYRYFSTTKRKFIIADTPGHEQYTRNMATGASTADVAIVLIDARAYAKAGGLLPQSRRHTYIASLLAFRTWSPQSTRWTWSATRRRASMQFAATSRHCAHSLACPASPSFPSARSKARMWSRQPPRCPGTQVLRCSNTSRRCHWLWPRPPAPCVSRYRLVLRPDANFRGFAGQVARGTLRAGDRVMALPSRRETTVRRIVTYDGDLPAASHPQSITVELADEIDLSRGEMLVAASAAPDALPGVSNHFRAMVVWMHEDPLVPGRTYIAKHTTRSVRATVRAIRYRVDVSTLDHLASGSIAMNEIAEVEFETNLPLFFDSYRDCRWTGSLILIDPLTNATVGAVMISGALDNVAESSAESETASLILVAGQPDRAARVRDALLARGDRAVLIDDPLITDSAVPSVIRALSLAGIIAVSSRILPQAMLAEIEAFAGILRVEGEQDELSILRKLSH